MTARGFVLVHGFWHDHHTWDAVVPLLEAAGHPVAALDLPGAGAKARVPASHVERPLDPARYASEPSPNAGVTQDERSAAVLGTLRALNDRTGRASVLVGHSMGGATVSDVAERAPEEVAAVVYLCAFLLKPGMMPIEMIQHPLMAGALPPTLFLADPGAVGALRIDTRSEDPDYVERMRQAFGGDMTPEAFRAGLAHKHPDEPAQVVARPSAVTPGRFGAVPRHYIHCTEDRAVLYPAQQEMVRSMDAAMGTTTKVHVLHASHSPFASQPKAVCDILLGLA